MENTQIKYSTDTLPIGNIIFLVFKILLVLLMLIIPRTEIFILVLVLFILHPSFSNKYHLIITDKQLLVFERKPKKETIEIIKIKNIIKNKDASELGILTFINLDTINGVGTNGAENILKTNNIYIKYNKNGNDFQTLLIKNVKKADNFITTLMSTTTSLIQKEI